MKKSVCLFFEVHHACRVKRYRFFDIGKDHCYLDDFANRTHTQKMAERCYLPANQVLLDLIKAGKGTFKVAFSISGIALQHLQEYAPRVIDSFKALAKTGCVEFVGETFAHSLASLRDEQEFRDQVKLQSDELEALFGQKPVVFRNSEMIYSDAIGVLLSEMGFQGALTEGAKHVLGWKSPNYVYNNPLDPHFKVLLRNAPLSDDLSLRFSDRQWDKWPLTADTFASWLSNVEEREQVVNLFMDYGVFGDRNDAASGIFDFLMALPEQVLKSGDFAFRTPSEVLQTHAPVAALDVPYSISWKDEEKDLTPWLGNVLQNEAFDKLMALGAGLRATANEELLMKWRCLQNSDHFSYMATKWFSDGQKGLKDNPFETPYDAFINYMNVISDLSIQVRSNASASAAPAASTNAASSASESASESVSAGAASSASAGASTSV